MQSTFALDGCLWQGIFFIHSGLCELRASFLRPTQDVILEDKKATEQFGGVFRAIGSGSYFGDVSVLLDVTVTATVRSVADITMLYQCKGDALLDLLKHLPKSAAYMQYAFSLANVLVLAVSISEHLGKLPRLAIRG